MPKSVKRRCPHCNTLVLQRSMRRHLEKCSGHPPEKTSVRRARRPKEAEPEGKEKPAIETVNSVRRVGLPGRVSRRRLAPLQIESKRSRRVLGSRSCDLCGREVLETYRYAESSWGVVHLCRSCHQRRHPAQLGYLVRRPLQGGDFTSK